MDLTEAENNLYRGKFKEGAVPNTEPSSVDERKLIT